jgi:RNA polymerase sigma-70 factor (ECF subfamily)
MANTDDCVELVKKAQLGNKECLDRLAELARLGLRAYVYRLTLADDVTQDILQETMLEMFKFLNKLERADRFWPWLRRIAANKVHHHYERQQRRRTIPMSEIGYKGAQKDGREGVADLVTRELQQVVLMAMHQLKPRHRHVLVLRCYEEMKYAEIAEEMGCSEFGARRLFFRAKRSLLKELSRRGLGKGSLLMALVLFGKMTASSEAAAAKVAVTAATTKVGVAACAADLAVSKTTVLSLATAGALAVGTVVSSTAIRTSGPDKTGAVLPEETGRNLPMAGGQTNRADYEHWYYFPRGKDGPVITRLMTKDSRGGYYCKWMQDEEANYYFDRRKATLYINNYRQWHSDRSVWRLPTDTAELRTFLSEVEGLTERIEYFSGDGPGLLVVTERDHRGDVLWTSHHHNLLSEEYFQYNWTTEANVVDNRDVMHKRGWTHFRIVGQLDGQPVSGTGRLPFVYAASEQNGAWLRLRVGNDLEVVDSGAEARVYDARGHTVARYKGGSFFAGLGRPWMGLHTIDTVRRDAAEKKVWFETRNMQESGKAEVVLTREQSKLFYTIDLERDAIDKISFSTDNGGGELRFSYLQEIESVGDEFTPPRTKRYHRQPLQEPGVLWLLRLAEGGLVTNSN